MRHLRFWLLLGALLALSSCASLNEDQCRAGDWREIGFADGAAGRGAERIEAHRKACAEYGIVPDAAAWRTGRDQGLRLYCVPAKAYDVGSRGLSIAPGGTAAELTAMRPAHDRGRRYHDIGLRIDDVERDISRIEQRLLVLPPAAAGERSWLVSERSRLSARASRLRAEQRLYARWP